MIPNPALVTELVARALAEDIGPGDLSTQACIPLEIHAQGEFLAKQSGIVAGLYVVAECFRQAGPDCIFEIFVDEGMAFTKGAILAQVQGPAAQILTTERVALNFLQRLSGIATLAGEFVTAVAGTRARIVDTRKTTPGLRILEKAAVCAGGAYNHRYALYDGVILKDNHIAACGGIMPAVERCRQTLPHTVKIEVETADLKQVQEALEAKADIIMLDNMDLCTMRQAVEQIAGRALAEASGGVNLSTVRAIANTGVDLISVGCLTHSAPAIDISLQLSR